MTPALSPLFGIPDLLSHYIFIYYHYFQPPICNSRVLLICHLLGEVPGQAGSSPSRVLKVGK